MSKNLDLLVPEVKEQFLKLKDLALERFGIYIIITQTLRTDNEQSALYAQGRLDLTTVNIMRHRAGMGLINADENKKIVTKAPNAASTWHGFGMAFDIAITSPDGRRIDWSPTADWNNDTISDWDQVGSLADEVGLEWGGNFTNMYDAPHYQNRFGMTIAEARNTYVAGVTANISDVA
jgi:peptidoglycan L-alanyl-D-glutamate endopeptidase CwlK